jgi:menaquinol-cytochrome c reductase cytochrome b/c subunit
VSSEQQRRQFELYKKNVARRGKPFYPYAMFHDTVMSLVVVSVIVGLASLWYFTSGEEPGDSGVLGPRYSDESDPGTISFTPRPDWYFYFLF